MASFIRAVLVWIRNFPRQKQQQQSNKQHTENTIPPIVQAALNWLRCLFLKTEMELTLVGLQNSGKTTLVDVITSGRHSEGIIPTVGFNMHKMTKGRVFMKLWDIGGQRRLRSMWERYYHEKLDAARTELRNLLNKPQLANIPVLVLGNKNDLPGAPTVDQIIEVMNLRQIKSREVSCYSIRTKKQVNVDITLQWLIKKGEGK
ncbi:hypothetical protein BGW39_000211 [Mortierella sp. 14UC]|nr:hypothetical protein BGW39_000211 [Mortierella sp. 14UC]